ncbi:MAG: Holliday junction branch migration protein RuvA [Clostridia bacterium]|nr:Holliday junction branch migration protein RuvA [Clostridia bacterium]
MYAFISGILDSASNGIAVVDCNGVGYEINISPATINKLPAIGKSVKLYTYLHVREDAMELFGFLTAEEKEIYEILISVSGVGPKVGLAILSTLEPNSFIHAVINGDAKAVAKAPGVGPKLAQRIILELKDKFKGYGVADIGVETEIQSDGANEAVEALTALGYTVSEATKAVAGLTGSVEQIVGQALKNLMRRG